jgi:hypothetical protein
VITARDSSEPFVFVYDELEWAAVVATLPNSLATAADLDAERLGLEFVATSYLNLTYHHRIRSANGFPTKVWQRKRKQIANDLAEAEKDGSVEELPALREALRHADAAVEGWEILGRKHQGRQDPACDWLYAATHRTWKRLGGKISVKRLLFGRAEASGPMIDFMIAALTPIMKDDTPGAEALAKFVKNTRKAEKTRKVTISA